MVPECQRHQEQLRLGQNPCGCPAKGMGVMMVPTTRRLGRGVSSIHIDMVCGCRSQQVRANEENRCLGVASECQKQSWWCPHPSHRLWYRNHPAEDRRGFASGQSTASRHWL